MSPHAAFETLTVNGRHVIPAREAAQRSGWSQNYIGILCRAGKVAGVRLSSGWLVDELSLQKSLAERSRRKEQLREDLQRRRREEYALASPRP